MRDELDQKVWMKKAVLLHNAQQNATKNLYTKQVDSFTLETRNYRNHVTQETNLLTPMVPNIYSFLQLSHMHMAGAVVDAGNGCSNHRPIILEHNASPIWKQQSEDPSNTLQLCREASNRQNNIYRHTSNSGQTERRSSITNPRQQKKNRTSAEIGKRLEATLLFQAVNSESCHLQMANMHHGQYKIVEYQKRTIFWQVSERCTQ